MNGALEKSLALIIFIGIGVLLKKRFSSGKEVNGLKHLILMLALPATIFIALLKIKVDAELLVLPFFALLFNILLFLVSPLLLNFTGITKKSPAGNTLRLLLPSLAPGLSCFPFILEFLGEPLLAKAAMADLGNKFFVLFVLYLVAIKWHYQNAHFKKESLKYKLQSLLKSLITEPVNLFIFAALLFISLGITLNDFPFFISSILNRLSVLMTPLVLLFIGLALKFKRKQFFQIFSLLMLRAATGLFLVAAVVSLLDITVANDILFMLAFALSACSFWPFAHISGIAYKEKDLDPKEFTFNMDVAMAVLALSLPLSVFLILTVLTAGSTFSEVGNILVLATGLFCLGSILPLIKWLKSLTAGPKPEKIPSNIRVSNNEAG
jgi:hypothetical protein